MNTLWPMASRDLLNLSKRCSSWEAWAGCALRNQISSYHASQQRMTFSSMRKTKAVLIATGTFATKPKPSIRALYISRSSLGIQNRPQSTAPATKVAKDYDDVPIDYSDEQGLPFRTRPLTSQEAVAIFGPGIDAATANHVMKVMHGRRVAGTLPDPSLPIRDIRLSTLALTWLRANVSVDEEEAAGRRAEVELAAMESEVLADAERLGIHRPNEQETVPEGKHETKSVYGRSGLDAIRKAREKQLDEAEARKEAQKQEISTNTGTLMTTSNAGGKGRSQVVLRRPGENPRLKYYLERAARDVPEVPPEMTILQRIGPSALFTLFVISACILYTTYYTPPLHRIWPNMPPAAATITSIIIANSIIFVLWRVPPAYRMLNRYFLSVPGYPRAAAVLGNVFSHQSLKHLVMNMLVLWFMGTRLHDDIGRSNFLALYVSSGVTSTLFSMTSFTIARNFIISSLGASGAVAGIVACYLYLHGGEYFKVLSLPPDPMKGVPGYGLLGLLIAGEIISQRMSRGSAQRFDHMAHFGGYAAGIAGGEILDRNIKRRRRMEIERRKNMTMIEKIKDWKT